MLAIYQKRSSIIVEAETFVLLVASSLFFMIHVLSAQPKASSTSAQDNKTLLEAIQKRVDQMDLRELIGQTLIIGCKIGDSAEASNKAILELISQYRPGGIILYGHNFNQFDRSRDDKDVIRDVRQLIRDLQDESYKVSPKMPLFIAIDQEGGGQSPLQKGVTLIPYAVQLGATRSARLAFQAGEVVGSELKSLGFNMVLAPVADVNNNNNNDIIGRRAFGGHADLVTPMSEGFMKGLRDGGVLSVAKHFPGHGSSPDDPHYFLPKLGYSDRSQLDQNDLKPFRKLIEDNVDGILTAHIMAEVIDKDNPVTISRIATQGLLRTELHYGGLILTDDLSRMAGILKDPQDPYGNNARTREEIAKKAYQAGNDILIFGQISSKQDQEIPKDTVTIDDFSSIYREIENYFAHDPGNVSSLKESVVRILEAKALYLGSLTALSDPKSWTPQYDESSYLQLLEEHKKVVLAIAQKSVILVSEDGLIINELSQSKYFGANKGPLCRDVLLVHPSEKITIVSPVFEKDELSTEIKNDWISDNRIHVVHMVYGWITPDALKTASDLWGEPVELLVHIDKDTGKQTYDEEAINEKANEIIASSADSKVIVFGLLNLPQIKVLEKVCSAYAKDTKKIIVLLLRGEPYFIDRSLYEMRNTIFIYAPAFPDMSVAKDVLFGKLPLHPVSYLPVSIPGKVDRVGTLGAPIEPLEPSSSPYRKPENGTFWTSVSNLLHSSFFLAISGGVLGALIFFFIPRGYLRWNVNAKGQCNIKDLFYCSIVGVTSGAFIGLLLPYLDSADIWGFKLKNLQGLSSFAISAGATIVVLNRWLTKIRK